MEKIVLVRVLRHYKAAYGMYAKDWYVEGYDAEGKYHEGWASDFVLPANYRHEYQKQ